MQVAQAFELLADQRLEEIDLLLLQVVQVAVQFVACRSIEANVEHQHAAATKTDGCERRRRSGADDDRVKGVHVVG